MSSARALICWNFDRALSARELLARRSMALGLAWGRGDVSKVGNSVHAATPAVAAHAVRRIWVCATAGSASLTVVLCLVHWWVM
jgi:hypothetical protein